ERVGRGREGPNRLARVREQGGGLGVGEAEVDQGGQSGLDIVRERLAHAGQVDGDLQRGPFGGGGWIGDHFTAPAVRPATKFFCIIRKPTTTGIDTAIEAARIWFQYTVVWVAYWRSPTASVRVSSVVSTEANSTSPHAVMKA